MSDLYSEFLVKKESTAKDTIVKYGLIVLTILAAGAGLFISPLLLVLAIALGVACYFVIPRTDLDQIHLPDPVLNDIKELQQENIRLHGQLRKMIKNMRCLEKRGETDEDL